MLLLQTAYLTAIAVLVEEQSAVQANSQDEKWVCTAAGVSISHWGGLLLLRELHPTPLQCCNCSSSFCGKIHISIRLHSSKSLGEAWIPFLCLLDSETIMNIITYYTLFEWRQLKFVKQHNFY